MTDHDEPQRSGTSSADPVTEQPAAEETPAAPIVGMLANPRRVRRA